MSCGMKESRGKAVPKMMSGFEHFQLCFLWSVALGQEFRGNEDIESNFKKRGGVQLVYSEGFLSYRNSPCITLQSILLLYSPTFLPTWGISIG